MNVKNFTFSQAVLGERLRATLASDDKFNVSSDLFSCIGECKFSIQDCDLLKSYENIIKHLQNEYIITLCPSSESTETHNKTEISNTASCILDDAMAEYVAMQNLKRVINNAKVRIKLMIGGKRLYNKETCEHFESELEGNALYQLIKAITAETPTGRLNMRSVELCASALEVIDDIRKIHKCKTSIPLPAHTILCDNFTKIISETKPSSGAECGDRQVETVDEKTGEETWLAKTIKVLVGMSAYIILKNSGVEEYNDDADDLDKYCRGLNDILCNEIKLRYLAMINDSDEFEKALRDYLEGNLYLGHYLLTGVMDTEEIPCDASDSKLKLALVEEAFSLLYEAHNNDGNRFINSEQLDMVVRNFNKWYNEGKTFNIRKIKTKASVRQLINVCKAIRNKINDKKHRLTIEEFEEFLRAQFSDLENRKKPFLTH